MEREKIIKALECCGQDGIDYCRECPIKERCRKEPNLPERMALSLIKELIEEIKFHRKTIAENAQKALDVALEEIEKTKADTVRKMKEAIDERCIKGGIYPVFVKRTIDQIAKEILEGNDDGKAD